jgi:hypothetical protein
MKSPVSAMDYQAMHYITLPRFMRGKAALE